MPDIAERAHPAAITVLIAILVTGCATVREEKAEGGYPPNWESIQSHKAPDWYHDAKFGIFIHWGLYSVPAWAVPSGELGKVDWKVWFRNNPYAEWYMNTLRIEGSPTQEHHFKTYGKNFDYVDFAPQFNQAIAKWDPDAMAALFAEVGARYVVLTSKHHDGFTLWPSKVNNPNRPPDRQHAARDLVGELTKAVRAKGMRMALYYSGGLDWSFTKEPVLMPDDVRGTIIHTDEYARYADAHWRELIELYQPVILWNDIGYPKPGDLEHIFADFYNRFPDGLVNDRFEIGIPGSPRRHHDFVTPEYAKMDTITDYKWETCRGLGFSFGYNQVEGDKQTIPERDLIHLLVDIVSKNGNLLLNVGPKADGSIPEIQAQRLRALGRWLDVNGEAIFETRPWQRADGKTADGGDVRFTRKGDVVYAILMSKPKSAAVTIKSIDPPASSQVTLLGAEGKLESKSEGGDLVVRLPAKLPESHAYTLKIAPAA
ncbi:MAG: alpha-L-fucosidase [Bryobacteraceae bacterium]|nr:alpha-L-fucosidase [Bryobacteraceae bacterium]